MWISGVILRDNGPEFVAKAIQEWLSLLDVVTLYVVPASPWQNGYAESFHSRLRDESLNMEESDSARHACAQAAARREDNNGCRLYGSLSGLPPDEFARWCADSVPATRLLHQHTETKLITQNQLS